MNNNCEYYYLILILIIIIFIFYNKCNIEQLKSIGHYGSISKAPVEVLEQAYLKKRSPKFTQLIKQQIINKIGINTIHSGRKCIFTLDQLCMGDSKCIKSNGNSICTAGTDGINPVGKLSYTNSYGSYDNGNEHYLPRETQGCKNNDYKCSPRYKCHSKHNFCIQKPIPIIERADDIESTRLNFSPPLPLINIPK